jgi:hypothetical protein
MLTPQTTKTPRLFRTTEDGLASKRKQSREALLSFLRYVGQNPFEGFCRGRRIKVRKEPAADAAQKKKRQNMKVQNRILLASATLMTALFINVAIAQSQGVGADGIAASPKVRQQIEERNRSQSATPAPAKTAGCCQAPVAQGCKSCCAK